MGGEVFTFFSEPPMIFSEGLEGMVPELRRNSSRSVIREDPCCWVGT